MSSRTSLVVQWIRIRLPVHGFDPWSGKISHDTEKLNPCATTTEAYSPIACGPQQEKPPQREAHTPQRRVDSDHSN